MDMTRFFGLDAFEWSVTLASSALIALAVWVAGLLIRRAIDRSMIRHAMEAISEDEDAAAAAGVNVTAEKLKVTLISAMMTALAGALYAPFAGFASPELFFWLVSGRVLIMVIVGGTGTLIGPILGGVGFLCLEQELSRVTDVWPLIFGSIFIAFVMFAPQGIWGLLTRRARADPHRVPR